MKKCFFSSRLFSRNDYRQMLNLLSIKSRFQARSGFNATFFKSLVLSLAPIRLCCTAWWARAVHSNSYKRTAHNNKLSHSLSLYFYFLSLAKTRRKNIELMDGRYRTCKSVEYCTQKDYSLTQAKRYTINSII